MLYSLFIGMATAQQMAILSSETTDTASLSSDLDGNAEMIAWSDLQELPLVITNADIKGKCSGLAKSLSDIELALSGVIKSLDYLELEKADGHMRRVENNFHCLNEIAPASLLSQAYFLSGLTYFYREDQEKTVKDWEQAIVFDPNIEWNDLFEPSGKPLFQSTKDELRSVAEAQLVLFPSTATVVIDGQERKSGDSIPAGLHLVQHGQLNIKSYFIEVEAGTDVTLADFSGFANDVGTAMSDPQQSQELLLALQLLPDFNDFLVASESTLWTLSMGGDSWKSKPRAVEKPANTVVERAEKEAIPSLPSAPQVVERKRHPALMYASVGALGLGGASLLMARSKYNQFLAEGDDTLASQHVTQNAVYYWAGTGLSVAAGGLLIAGTVKW